MIGNNIIQNDWSHFGFFGVVVVPTGNRPKAKYIFEPLVGNGRHWEVGNSIMPIFLLTLIRKICSQFWILY